MGALDEFLAGGKGVQPQDMATPKRTRPIDPSDINDPRNFNAKDPAILKQIESSYKNASANDFRVAPKTDQRIAILQQELADEQAKLQAGDTRAQTNIDALNREIQFVSGKAPAKQQTSASALDDFLSGGQPQELGPPIKVSVSGGAPLKEMPPTPMPAEPSMMDKFGRSVAGLADTAIGGIQTLPGMALAETGYAGVRAMEGLGLAEPGRAERGKEEAYKRFVEPFAQPVGQTMGVTGTPEYKGEASQQVMQFVSENLDKGADWISKNTGVPKSDVQNMMNTLMVAAPSAAKGVKNVLQEQLAGKAPVAPKVEPTMAEKPRVTYDELQKQLQRKKGKPFEMPMAGVGAAKTANASVLAEAISRASPELKAELSKVKPGELNVEALNRVMDADQLPVPVRLTRGQATQDPMIISNELNQRGIKDQVVAHLNEQNKALQENASLIKEKAAPDINTTSFVEDAENNISRMEDRIKADDAKITEAYTKLKDFGAGKLSVDSQTVADNALKALSEFDEQEFLPSSILSRINSYKEGKAMNFNQFENERTITAREIRKAQAANDGNAVHALTVWRSELEKIPLLNETAEAKALADNARSLAKSQFDLLDKKRDTYNPVYAEIMNGVSDTKDFIPKLVFRSKNKDFVKAIDTIGKDDPIAMQHLKSGALDYMIRESTDASGNFKTAKFADFIEKLDVNKKLDPLFGEEAKTLRIMANTGKAIGARPKGSFVNESNTAVAAAQMAKQYGAELLKKIPGVAYFAEPASQILQQRQIAKEVKKTIKPAAGVKLSDIGKK